MCGITGGFTREVVNKTLQLELIKHRGPDSDGFFLGENIFLGHTRLSILDLSERGNQPMFSDDGNYVIVFNGEIYNHLEIRKQLTEFKFKSSSDTETILYSYIKFGDDCLKLFNGIFAFSIYNTITNELFIARDQLGVKPLYIYQDEKMFLFSSEIKSFLGFNIFKDLDFKAISDYLSFLWSPGQKTPFKYIKKLLPGHFIKISSNGTFSINQQKYYEIPFSGKYLKNIEPEIIDSLEEKLLKSVERQMLSDVPIGFFLSGGLDSSLIVAMAKKIQPNKRFPCFTIDTTDFEDSEGFASDLYFARKVAKHLDVELNIVKTSIDIIKDFDKMIWHLDEPQADAAPLNVLQICNLARENGIKVLLGGAGGDDLFSGYRRHQALNYEKYFKIIPPFIKSGITSFSRVFPANRPLFRRIRKIAKDLNQSPYQRMFGYFEWIEKERKYALFSNDSKTKLQDYKSTDYFVELLKEIPNEKNALNSLLFLEMKTFLVDHNLNYTDKLSMAVGVEARVPFLDIELVEFATKIPPGLKMKGMEAKYILKKVAERYLPKDVIYRPKSGFGVPIRKWITNDLEEMIGNRLSKDNIDKRGIFNSDEVWKLIDDNKNGKIDVSYVIWSLLAIDSWCRQFIDGEKLF